MLRDCLEKWKNEENLIVMFTDAYDVIIYENLKQIVKKFKKFDARVVFGAEYFCNPDSKKAELFPVVRENEKRFLNSGCYIGYVGDVYAIISYIINQFETGSQDDNGKCYYSTDTNKKVIGLYRVTQIKISLF